MSNQQKPKFGTKVLDSIKERIEPVESLVSREIPAAAGPDEPVWVSYTTAITQETYLALKRAEFWVPGFVMKEAAERALVQYLDTIAEQLRPIPNEEKLLATNKKLQGYKPL